MLSPTEGHGPKHLVQSPVSICSAASAATGLLIPGYQNLIRADRDTLARGATSLSVQDEDHRDDAHRIVDLPATDKCVQPVLFIFQLHNAMDTIWNPHPQQSRYCAKHRTHILSQRNIRMQCRISKAPYDPRVMTQIKFVHETRWDR